MAGHSTVTHERALVPFIPDVSAANNAISFDLAARTARCAERLHDQNIKLPFLNHVNPAITQVWLTGKERGVASIYDSPAEVYRNRSFLRAAGVMCGYAGIAEPEFIGIMYSETFEELEEHQELFDGGRTLLTVSGLRTVCFPFRSVEGAESSLAQGPCDIYKMDFHDDNTSIRHAAETFIGGFALYVNHYGPNYSGATIITA